LVRAVAEGVTTRKIESNLSGRIHEKSASQRAISMKGSIKCETSTPPLHSLKPSSRAASNELTLAHALPFSLRIRCSADAVRMRENPRRSVRVSNHQCFTLTCPPSGGHPLPRERRQLHWALWDMALLGHDLICRNTPVIASAAKQSRATRAINFSRRDGCAGLLRCARNDGRMRSPLNHESGTPPLQASGSHPFP
jgi:hypothetical protein